MHRLYVMLLVIFAAGAPLRAEDLGPLHRRPQLREPIGLALVGEHQLWTANRRSGTVSIIDLARGEVVAEQKVAERIADIVSLANGRFLILDDAKGELLLAEPSVARLNTRRLANVAKASAKLAVDAERSVAYVSSPWARKVTAISFDEGEMKARPKSVSIALPFAPRELLLVRETLLAADAFGGRVAVIDAPELRLQKLRKINGHNIRGLAASEDGKQVLVAHQQFAGHARADYEELHWGRLLANAVQVFDAADVMEGTKEALAPGWLDEHGGIGGATGDPARVLTGAEGLVAVSLAGVGEVSVRRRGYAKRIQVESRPGAMLATSARLYVANRFSDSVSEIDLREGRLLRNISLGRQPKLNSAQRGERLFFDARLSHDGWMSCHSCHTDGHSAGLLVDTLGDGDYGAPKRVPSLLGTRGTGPWAWDGSMKTLEAQVRKSVATTMHGEPLSEQQTADLTAFLRNLPAPPPIQANRQVELGRKVFKARGCAECHQSPTFTSGNVFDVGLVDERKRRQFNPPSLRGVGHRPRLFHDGRAANLEEVLQRYRHQLDEPLSAADRNALLSFLRSL